MRKTNTYFVFLIGSMLFARFDGCSIKDQARDVKIATFNLSFDRKTFENLVAEMLIEPLEQDELVTAYLDGILIGDAKITAEKVIQIRNVAAIIQKNQPDILLMAEYNNDGVGENKTALENFQKNYLSFGQSFDGAGGVKNLEPIEYAYAESYPTNTGLLSNFDLDNNGIAGQLPGDAWGFGVYHGQYAFSLLSKYEIMTESTRTFQKFKWIDMEGSEIPTITICDGSQPIPDGMSCG